MMYELCNLTSHHSLLFFRPGALTSLYENSVKEMITITIKFLRKYIYLELE